MKKIHIPGHEAALNEAKKWIGIQEKEGNTGWLPHDVLNSERFESIMKQVGWRLSHAWCAYFSELCWTVPTFSGKSKYLKKMQSLFSGSVMMTYNNYKNDKSGLFIVDMEPVPGAVAIWQTYRNGEPHTTGHAAIVELCTDVEFTTIEGNTNAQGGREGVEVAKMSSSYRHNLKSAISVNNGLRLKGFIKMAAT